ncbi:MAG: transposase [Caulobacteraceae bacterium]
MPRQSRVIRPSLPHHVTQRGNHRQRTFFSPADYDLYLALAAQEFVAAEVEVWAYCLMPNHVHLIATPSDEIGLSRAVGRTHLRYTTIINQREGRSGHLWQGRFASAPMDWTYLARCVRYVAMNPVRAGLVESAGDWPWSSTSAHLGQASNKLLTRGPIESLFDDDPDFFFGSDLARSELIEIRNATAVGRMMREA